MWAFFQGIWAQSILDIYANANQTYRAGASYFRLVWLWWCLISKISMRKSWCELPERLDLISFWKIAIMHTPFRHVSPAPILCAALMLGCHMENWHRLVVTLSVEAWKKLVEGLVILETSRATTKCLWRLCHQHTRKLNSSTSIFSFKNWCG